MKATWVKDVYVLVEYRLMYVGWLVMDNHLSISDNPLLITYMLTHLTALLQQLHSLGKAWKVPIRDTLVLVLFWFFCLIYLLP